MLGCDEGLKLDSTDGGLIFSTLGSRYCITLFVVKVTGIGSLNLLCNGPKYLNI